jgi:hypothetical protein
MENAEGRSRRLNRSQPMHTMKKLIFASVGLALLSSATLTLAQEPPQLPPPVKEHEWLKHFVGEWESDMEVVMAPGQPPVKGKSSEIARNLGGFWVVSEGKGEMMGMPFSHILTLGYDPDKKKFVGTWIDSMGSYLWNYVGTVDATGKILTLETEGPCPTEPGKNSKFREVTEFKSADHRVFTSSIQQDDGTWHTMVTIHSRRKK